METIKFTCQYFDEIPGSANLKFEVSIPQSILATFYWADENGNELENYLPIKSIPLFEGKGEYVTNKNLVMPQEARKIRCRIFKDTMKEINLPELVIDIPQEKQWKPKGKLLKTYIAGSDIHIGGEYFNNAANRITALSTVRDMKPDAFFIAGDIANGSKDHEFDQAMELINEYLEGIPVYISPGNHDYSPYEEGAVANIKKMAEFYKCLADRNVALGEKCSDPEDRNYYVGTASGATVLVINPCREDEDQYLGEEQLKWIDQKLTETDGERYRFMITHLQQQNTVGRPQELMGEMFFRDNDELQAILDKHKNVIHMSGHTHYDFDSEGVNTLVDNEHQNIYINNGCLVWCNVYFEKRREYYVQDRCTAQVIEVYEDCILLKGLEFVSGKYVPRCLHRAMF